MSEPRQTRSSQEVLADPVNLTADAHIVFIGRVRSPWLTRADCPRNLMFARERGLPARLEINPAWRAGLTRLGKFTHLNVLYWLHEAQRELLVLQREHHPEPRGVFSTRSPARPNPIGLAVVRILALDEAAGTIDIDAIDCLDGTPLIDVKPYFAGIDAVQADHEPA